MVTIVRMTAQNISAFYGKQGSLMCSLMTIMALYPEPNTPSKKPSQIIYLKSVLKVSFHLHTGLPSCTPLSDVLSKSLNVILILTCTL
jgi:hypothetical protein